MIVKIIETTNIQPKTAYFRIIFKYHSEIQIHCIRK